MALVSLSTNVIKIQQAITSTQHNPYNRNLNHRKAYNGLCSYYYVDSQFSYQPTSSSQRHRGLLPVLLGVGKSESGGGEENDKRALETVLKLYSAIKTKNIRQLSDLIGDECNCLCNVFTGFRLLQGKKQVVDFFSYLITTLGNHVDFVVTPTMHDGMKVQLRWKLEWNRTHVPLGNGFSIHICHVYRGKVVIRHVEMFLEPLLHIEHFRLVAIGFVTTIIDKMRTNPIFKDKPRSVLYVLLRILILAILLFFGKCTLTR